MRRKTIVLAVILVVVTFFATSLFWYVLSFASIWLPRYRVAVRWRGVNVLVVFFQDNRTIASCVVSTYHQLENVTLPEGSYLVKLYNAASGVFVKQYEIYVAKDIEFLASTSE